MNVHYQYPWCNRMTHAVSSRWQGMDGMSHLLVSVGCSREVTELYHSLYINEILCVTLPSSGTKGTGLCTFMLMCHIFM
ncbi:hypothetical protein XELAEV_18046186mg [Xenopus laevis]|uniref:Uncharacterized protein n=1 Tax=Xenopus laevis TaxID=8355 RepID=A0A974H0D3_XENLA|nr:hypothetical protein XELAEV_18046186mg [Xenopus laevis]